MSDVPVSPAAPPPPAPPPPSEPRKRGWFVVLAWITLVGFGIFVAAVTVLSIVLPAIARARGR